MKKIDVTLSLPVSEYRKFARYAQIFNKPLSQVLEKAALTWMRDSGEDIMERWSELAAKKRKGSQSRIANVESVVCFSSGPQSMIDEPRMALAGLNTP